MQSKKDTIFYLPYFKRWLKTQTDLGVGRQVPQYSPGSARRGGGGGLNWQGVGFVAVFSNIYQCLNAHSFVPSRFHRQFILQIFSLKGKGYSPDLWCACYHTKPPKHLPIRNWLNNSHPYKVKLCSYSKE